MNKIKNLKVPYSINDSGWRLVTKLYAPYQQWARTLTFGYPTTAAYVKELLIEKGDYPGRSGVHIGPVVKAEGAKLTVTLLSETDSSG